MYSLRCFTCRQLLLVFSVAVVCVYVKGVNTHGTVVHLGYPASKCMMGMCISCRSGFPRALLFLPTRISHKRKLQCYLEWFCYRYKHAATRLTLYVMYSFTQILIYINIDIYHID